MAPKRANNRQSPKTPKVTKTAQKTTKSATKSASPKFHFRLVTGNPFTLICCKTNISVTLLHPIDAKGFFQGSRFGNVVGGSFSKGYECFCFGRKVCLIRSGKGKDGGGWFPKSLSYEGGGNPLVTAFRGKTIKAFSEGGVREFVRKLTEEPVRVVAVGHEFNEVFLRVYKKTYHQGRSQG